MRIIRIIPVLVSSTLLALSASPAVHAQATNNLATYVTNPANGATALQQNAGVAVQRTCTQMVAQQVRIDEATVRGDLFRRCNEFVETARSLQPGTYLPAEIDRSLGVTGTQLLADVQQIAGEELAAQGVLTSRVSNGQFSNISGRLNALRIGNRGAGARGRLASLWDPRVNGTPGEAGHGALGFMPLESAWRTAPAPQSEGGGGASAAPAVANPWGWFVDGSYSQGDRDPTANEDGFDFDTSSVTAGVDYNFGSGVLGASLGYDNYEADFDQGALVSGGSVQVKGVSGSVFGAWFGDRWSVNGIVSYGTPESDISRNVVYASNRACTPACGNISRTLTGSPDGDYVAAGGVLLYQVSAGYFDVTASGGLSYRQVKIDSFAEDDTSTEGGLALAYASQTIDSLRSILGVTFSRPITTGFGVVQPNLRLEWHHEFEDDARSLRAKYVVGDLLEPSTVGDFATCTSCFEFKADPQDADFGVVGLGVSFVFANRLQAYVEYEGLIGVSDLSSNTIGVGLRGQF